MIPENRKGGLALDLPAKTKNRFIYRLSTAPLGYAAALLIVLSLFMDLLIEALGRRSLIAALGFMTEHPILFLYNSLIILFTLSLCLIAKKRLTALFFVSTLWLALGVTNFIVLTFRSSPLSAIDFLIVRAALGMFSIYLSWWQIVLIAVLAAAFIGLMIFLNIRCPKCEVSYPRTIGVVVSVGLAVLGCTLYAAKTKAITPDGELADSYSDYGFVYCFTRSLVSHGVEKPEDYDHDVLGELLESLDSTDTAPTDGVTSGDTAEVSGQPAEQPNIIYVQLESFFDVSHIRWLDCSEDPTPTFNSLKNGVSGYLTVENFGGGTANTEFEVLTGMNLDHFGFGEYPYTTILKSRACESIAQNLKTLGYSTHAIHNHTAVFYDRNVAYSSLGFETFTPVEMMTGVTYNLLGWERDDVLTGEIISALDSTESPDFVFTVTVQGHGKYPSEPLDPDKFGDSYEAPDSYDSAGELITISGTDDPAMLSQLTYYVNELRETDNFIKALIEALTERGEPCVVVFYGDHMPALTLTADDLTNGSLYETEYAVWTNTDIFGSDPDSLDRDLEAYMLSAYIQELCSIDEGAISRLHRVELRTGETDDDGLKMLEYSQLYDDAGSPYERTDMTFGTHPVIMTGWEYNGSDLTVRGKGFNKYSIVRVGGFDRATTFVDEETLVVRNILFADTVPEVWQETDNKTALAQAVYTEENT